MKMQLFGNMPEQSMRVLGGGYDAKTGRAVLVVQDENNHAGFMSFDVTEARDTAATLTRDLPSVVAVEPAKQSSGNGGGGGL